MKKVVKLFLEEHVEITFMFRIMDKMIEQLYQGKAVPKEHLDMMADFLTNYAQGCHSVKEEKVLYAALSKNPKNVPMINDLMAEHKAGWDYARGIQESLAHYEPANPFAIHIGLNAEGYFELLREHTRKENNFLLPIANRELSEQQDEAMVQQLEELDQQMMGQEKHRQYREWLHTLRNLYMKNDEVFLAHGVLST